MTAQAVMLSDSKTDAFCAETGGSMAEKMVAWATIIQRTCLTKSGLTGIIAGLAVVLGRVLELLDATAKTAHELRDFPTPKQQENDQNDQNDLSRSNGSHPMEFVTKVGEKTPSFPTRGINSEREGCR